MQEIRPAVVFVELCRAREGMLSLPLDGAVPQRPLTLEAVQAVLAEGGGLAGVLQLALAAFTQDAAAAIGLDITPGTEFAAAAQGRTTSAAPRPYFMCWPRTDLVVRRGARPC